MPDMLTNPRVAEALKQGYSLEDIKQYAVEEYSTNVANGMSDEDARAHMFKQYGLQSSVTRDTASRGAFLQDLVFSPFDETTQNQNKADAPNSGAGASSPDSNSSGIPSATSPNSTPNAKKPRQEGQQSQPQSLAEAFTAGIANSASGLLMRNELPEVGAPGHGDYGKQLLFSFGSMAGDIPFMAAGGLIGGAAGGVVGTAVPVVGNVAGAAGGSMAGAMALPAYFRRSLVDAYTRGEVTDVGEMFLRWGRASLAAAQEATIGAAGGISGALARDAAKVAVERFLSTAPKLLQGGLVTGATVGAETSGLALTSAATQLRMPTADDFIHSGLMVAGMRSLGAGVDLVKKAYVEDNIHPSELPNLIANNPERAQDLVVDASAMHKPTTREVYGMRERGKPEYVNDTAEMRVAGGDNRWLYLDRDDANSALTDARTADLESPAYRAYQKAKEGQTKAQEKYRQTYEKHISKFASDEDLMVKGYNEIFPDHSVSARDVSEYLADIRKMGTREEKAQARQISDRIDELMAERDTDPKYAKSAAQVQKAKDAYAAATEKKISAWNNAPVGETDYTPYRSLGTYDIPANMPVIDIRGLGTRAAKILYEKYIASEHAEGDPLVAKIKAKYDASGKLPAIKLDQAAHELITKAPPQFLEFVRSSQWTKNEIIDLLGPEKARKLLNASDGDTNVFPLGAKQAVKGDKAALYDVYWGAIKMDGRILPTKAGLVRPERVYSMPADMAEASARVKKSISFNPEDAQTTWVDRAKAFYASMVDRFTALNQGADKSKMNESYASARLASASASRAYSFMEHGTYDWRTHTSQSDGLFQIARSVPDSAQLSTYLTALETVNKARRGELTGADPKDAAALVKHLDTDPVYKAAVDKIYEYNKDLLQTARDAGLITAKQHKELLGGGTSIPLQTVLRQIDASLLKDRNLQEAASKVAKNNKALADWEEAKRALEESKSGISIDPLQSLAASTYTIFRAADVNTARKAIAKDWGIKDVVNAKEDTAYDPRSGDRLQKVTYYDHGKQFSTYVNSDIYGAFKALDNDSRTAFTKVMKVLSAPTGWMRAGATMDPGFTLRNMARDMFTAATQSKTGYQMGVDLVKGICEVVKGRTGIAGGNDMYVQWMREGGASGYFISPDRNDLVRQMNEVIKRPVQNVIRDAWSDKNYGAIASLINPFPKVMDGLRTLSEIGEQGPRLREYTRAIEAGYTGREAALLSREVTLDFDRAGTSMRAYNQICAFANAFTQGIDKEIRTMRDQPLVFMSNMVAGVIMPTLFLAAVEQDIMLNAPDSLGAKKAAEVPTWQRAAFWRIYAGKDYEYTLLIPKPHGLMALITTPVESFVHWMGQQRGESYLDHLKRDGMLDNLSNALTQNPMPTAIQPIAGVMADYNWFTKNKLVSSSLSNLLPEFQVTQTTTGTARAIGSFLSQIAPTGLPIIDKLKSPVNIDYLVQGYTGTLGTNVLKTLDYAAEIAGIRNAPARRLEDIPVISSFFFRYPQYSAYSIQEFNNQYQSMNQRYQTYMHLMEEGTASATESAQALALEGPLMTMTRLQSALAANTQMIQRTWASDQLEREEKRQLIDQMMVNQIQMARYGLQALQQVTSQFNERKER